MKTLPRVVEGGGATTSAKPGARDAALNGAVDALREIVKTPIKGKASAVFMRTCASLALDAAIAAQRKEEP